MCRLALGTVQFGVPYGISNTNGQVDCTAAKVILNHAKLACMDTLDTAISYGESEQCLGQSGVKGWKIITKLPELPSTGIDVSTWVNDQVQGSLSRLKLTHLTGLLLHRPNQLLGPKGKLLWIALQNLKQNGIVDKIGFSIYEPSELDELWPHFRPDIVQAPFNILDRRLQTSGWLQRMSVANVEVHVRSVFLQGLLLMNNENRPKKFERWSTLWSTWQNWLHKQELTALQASLAFVMADSRISRVVVGVDTLHQLKEILSSVDTQMIEFPETLHTNDLDLINPSRWTLL